MKSFSLFNQSEKLRAYQILYIALFIIALIFIFPRCFHLPQIENSVDGGWIWALRYFVHNKEFYQWGKDVIYTCGPLGIFSTRNFPSQYILWQFFVDIYIVLQLVIIFRIVLKDFRQTGIFLFLLALSVLNWEINLLLQCLNIYYVLFIICNKKKTWLVYLIALNVSFLLYAKLNTIIISFAILLLITTWLIKCRKFLQLIVFISIVVVANFLIIYLFNIDVRAYFLTSIPTINSFSYTMSYYYPGFAAVLVVGMLITIVAVLALLFNCLKIFLSNFFKSMALLILALYLFVLYKQGFVRMDKLHFTQYFSFIPFVCFTIYSFFDFQKKWISALIIGTSGIALTLTANTLIRGYPFYNTPCASKIPVINYVSDLLNSKAIKTEDAGYDHSDSNQTIDYFYNSCAYKKFNPQVNWKNRPAFQSIVSVSSSLDSINASTFKDGKGSAKIFYTPDVVDDRYFLWDEPNTFFEVLKNYRVDDELNDTIISFSKTQQKIVQRELILDTVVSFNSKINIPNLIPGIMILQAEVEENILGKLSAFAFQSPRTTITLFNRQDSVGSYRYMTPVHNNSPLIINHHFERSNIKEIHSFLSDLNGYNSNVDAFSINTKLEYLWQKPIRLKIVSLTIN